MEILFVRHGQPAWSVDGMNQTDPRLTNVGRKQARLLADRLVAEHEDISELLASDTRRSLETAEPIAAALDVDIAVVPDLTEIKMPDWTGTPVETVEELFHDAYLRPAHQWWDGMPGGESFRDFHDRVSRTIIDILKARGIVLESSLDDGQLWEVPGEARTLAVIAHAGTNAAALGLLLGLTPTPWEWERFVLGHASLARLRTFPIGGAHIFSMRSFNDMEHLPAELRTR